MIVYVFLMLMSRSISYVIYIHTSKLILFSFFLSQHRQLDHPHSQGGLNDLHEEGSKPSGHPKSLRHEHLRERLQRVEDGKRASFEEEATSQEAISQRKPPFPNAPKRIRQTVREPSHCG